MPSKRKQRSPVSFSDNDYGRFLASLRLFGLGLKNSSTMLDRNTYWELNSRKKGPSRKFHENYKVTRIEDDFFESEGSFELVVSESDLVGLRVACSFEVHIHATGNPIPRTMVERFTAAELRLILLPYARQFVSSITAQMQIPPVILPLANDVEHPSGSSPER